MAETPETLPESVESTPPTPPPDPAATEPRPSPPRPEPTRYGDWEKAGRCIDF